MSRMIAVPLEALLQNLNAPVAILDGQGGVRFANEAGWELLPGLTQAFVWLGDPSLRAEPDRSLLSLLINPSPIPRPTWFPCGEWLLKASPLSTEAEGGQTEILLEWVQPPGGESLRILQEVSRAVNSSLILEDIFESLGEVLQSHIPYREAAIVILDDTRNGIKILVRISEDGELEISRENNSFAGYDPVVSRILQHPSPQLYQKEALENLDPSVAISADSASAVAVPLVSKGVVIGLIALSSGKENGFGDRQRDLLVQVSEQLAVAVENAKFYWQTQMQAGREFLINRLTTAIRQSLAIDDILGTAVEELGRVTGVSRCFIHYFGVADGSPKTYAYSLPGVPQVTEPRFTDASFERGVFESRRRSQSTQSYNPFVLNDVRDCPATLAEPQFFERQGIKSQAVFPLLVRDALVGTITLHQCEAYRSWISEDIELLRAIAEHLGVALHQAKLFEELEKRKVALEKTLDELQQAQIHLIQSEKMAVLGQFVAGIAHEVNTPLGTMISNNATLKTCLDRLRSPGETADPETLHPAMADLLDLNRLASDRIQEIVKNLRNFARLDESELKTVDIHEGIDSTLLLMRSSIPTRIRVEKLYGEDVPHAQCYPGLLNQVFMNLLVNATHAMEDMPEGRITIESRFAPETRRIEVSFTDTGKGIAPEHLAKVFDPGFTTKGVGVGTGLGLALCYRIVEKHRGHISVESQPGQGTRFTVSIPA